MRDTKKNSFALEFDQIFYSVILKFYLKKTGEIVNLNKNKRLMILKIGNY
jgi:hypothetical protein